MLLNCQTVFSQSKVLVVEGDTLICNTVEQQKFWIKQYYRVQELQEKDSVNQEIISKLDSNYVDCQHNLADKDLQLENTEKIVEFKDETITVLNNELTEQKKATQRQKFYKWAAVSIGMTGTAIMTYLYLTK